MIILIIVGNDANAYPIRERLVLEVYNEIEEIINFYYNIKCNIYFIIKGIV